MKERAAVIIPAAGSGARMKSAVPKQYLELAGKPLLVHTLLPFIRCSFIDQIIVVAPADRLTETKKMLGILDFSETSLSVTAGGRRRRDSVWAGLRLVNAGNTIVLVHDGARPLVTEALIERCYRQIVSSGAAIAAVAVTDTLKRADDDNLVAATIDRRDMRRAQTPQGARTELLRRAFAVAHDDDFTDESSLLEAAAIPVRLVDGEETNIKITRQNDLLLAEALMHKDSAALRIGHGFDAHRFAPDRRLILGGVHIEHPLGLAGHSDADVITHALCDAILGAAALGDIGRHFPDNDERFRGISSLRLLDSVVDKTAACGLHLVNTDITIVCQAPTLAPHMEMMRHNLAGCCRVDSDRVNIKATTTERMGYTGRHEGISCHAVALLKHTPSSARRDK